MRAAGFPIVSICIPAYNQTAYLRVLLESLQVQTFTDFEIIISDDSTTDAVQELTTQFDFGERLRYYRNPSSLGSPANWNAAIEKARGTYIKIMHHDDAFNSPVALAKFVQLAEQGQTDYVFCDTYVKNTKIPTADRVHRIKRFDTLKKKSFLLFFGNSIGSPSTLMYRRSAFEGLVYDTRFIWLVDMEYYSRMLETSVNGAHLAEPLVLTHDAAEHQLTSRILTDYSLRIHEQELLYRLLAPKAPALTRMFMQVNLVRLCFKGGPDLSSRAPWSAQQPRWVKLYFSVIRNKPLYFAYGLLIRLLDFLRKIVYR